MKILIVLLLLGAPALAQNAREPLLEPQIVKACRMDLHLYCADARLAKECLVTRWTKLPDACQNALVLPSKAREGAGNQLGVPDK
jgi:hypothetical protein